MRTTVVTGLLGSGKTTLIRHLLKDTPLRTAVLVNDFGEVGIDGEVLSRDGIETLELPSGCVCCTLRLDLINGIRAIALRHAPEHLVIEPSGVASPLGVLDALDTLGIAPVSVIGVLDATEFADLCHEEVYGLFFLDQVRRSDVLVINKCDLAGPLRAREAEALASGMNPHAHVFMAENGRIPGLPHMGRAEGRVKSLGLVSGTVGGHILSYETVSIELERECDRDALLAVCNGMLGGRYGRVARAKALFTARDGGGSFKLDIASGRLGLVRLDGEISRGRLVVIGRGLCADALRADVLTRAPGDV